MTTQRALRVPGDQLGRVAFSGTLTYRELCGQGTKGCSAVGLPGTVPGYPGSIAASKIAALRAVAGARGRGAYSGDAG